MMDDATSIVQAGYDAIADRFAEWRAAIDDPARLEYAEDLLRRLPERPDILELGVGAGVPPTPRFAERGRLTGIDVSAEQLRRARERLPGAKLRQADATEVKLEPESFDAVVSFYVFNHVPQEKLGPLLERAATWLRAGGYLLANFPTRDNPGWRGDFLGTEMFFAGFAPAANRSLTESAGLTIVRDELRTIVEPDYGEGKWQWLLARKPKPA